MDATGDNRGANTGDPQVGRLWLLKVALMFALALLASVGLGIGLGIIPVAF